MHENEHRQLWNETDIAESGADGPKLKAWRLFFYIERIKYMDNIIKKPKVVDLDMKFKGFKENFNKVIHENIQH